MLFTGRENYLLKTQFHEKVYYGWTVDHVCRILFVKPSAKFFSYDFFPQVADRKSATNSIFVFCGEKVTSQRLNAGQDN